MQVDARGLACGSYVTHHIATLHLLPLAHCGLVEMGITGLVAIAVVEDHHVAIAPFVALHVDDLAVAGRVGLGIQWSRKV